MCSLLWVGLPRSNAHAPVKEAHAVGSLVREMDVIHCEDGPLTLIFSGTDEGSSSCFSEMYPTCRRASKKEQCVL